MLRSLVRLIVMVSVICYPDLGFCCSAGPAGRTLPTGNATNICEAKEHTNITLTCLYPVNAMKPPESLEIFLRNVMSMKNIYWFHYISRRVNETYTDESYRGRLECDRELFWTGQIQFLLMDLRLNDTGEYLCEVYADGTNLLTTTVDLSVTAATRKESTGETSEPPDQNKPRKKRERYGIWASLVLITLVILMLVLRYCQVQISPLEA